MSDLRDAWEAAIRKTVYGRSPPLNLRRVPKDDGSEEDLTNRQVLRLVIPDSLVEWGQHTEAAIYWKRPWAHEVAEICKRFRDRPMDEYWLERLLSRLEALAVEAVRAGRSDLLQEMDLWTARALGLSLRLTGPDAVIDVGQGKRWGYGELEHLLEHADPPKARQVAEEAKDLVGAVFPDARIDAIIEPDVDPVACAGCGATEMMVAVDMEGGVVYCGSCMASLTKPPPVLKKRGGRKTKKGKR